MVDTARQDRAPTRAQHPLPQTNPRVHLPLNLINLQSDSKIVGLAELWDS